MPFLARKFMMPANICKISDIPNADLIKISADVSTNEFKTKDSKLSVWLIDSSSQEDLDKAALAISMSGNCIETITFLLIDVSKVIEHFDLDSTPGSTAAISLVNIHRDICKISHNSLNILLSLYKEAVDNKKIERYRASELKQLVSVAIKNGQIDIETASDKLKTELVKLQETCARESE